MLVRRRVSRATVKGVRGLDVGGGKRGEEGE